MRNRFLIIILIISAPFIGIVISPYFTETANTHSASTPLPKSNTKLLTGNDAVTDKPVAVPLNAPEEFDGLTRKEVLKKRLAKIALFENTLVSKYSPLNEIFGAIADKEHWWGVYGHFYYLNPKKNIDGPSEESRFVLNPYLLVAPEFFGYSVWNDGFKWNEKSTPQMVAQNKIPLIPFPEKLVWQPKLSSAEVHYPVSAWLKKIAPYVTAESLTDGKNLMLMPVNARDMGFNYLSVDWDQSTQVIKNPPALTKPALINNYFHLGGSCGYQGGCNNESPYNADLADYIIQKIPAKVAIKLWRKQPASVSSDADFTFTIYID